MTEDTFPTIRDASEVLDHLVEKGFGDLPLQFVIVPPSTLAALAKDAGHSGGQPTLMIEMFARDGAEVGLLIASVENLLSGGVH